MKAVDILESSELVTSIKHSLQDKNVEYLYHIVNTYHPSKKFHSPESAFGNPIETFKIVQEAMSVFNREQRLKKNQTIEVSEKENVQLEYKKQSI